MGHGRVYYKVGRYLLDYLAVHLLNEYDDIPDKATLTCMRTRNTSCNEAETRAES